MPGDKFSIANLHAVLQHLMNFEQVLLYSRMHFNYEEPGRNFCSFLSFFLLFFEFNEPHVG